MSTAHFYQALPGFTDFNEITKDEHYRPVPADWSVIITDVQGSTQAIAAGRYKEVNALGAASIVVVRKALRGLDFPFVFGGDGATLLVPSDYLVAVLQELGALRRLAKESFALSLRVGSVKMTELLAEQSPVEVARYEITPGRHIAFLRGIGVGLAEEKIKKYPGKYESPMDTFGKLDLSGLSCRWQPIPSQRGSVLSVLVLSRRESGHIYDAVLAGLTKILPGELDAYNPANISQMTYKSIAQCLRDERKYYRSIWSFKFFRRLLEIVFAVMIFKFKVPPLVFKPNSYAQAMRTHSDFRKFDDTLRMTLDCSPKQCAQIRAFLQELCGNGDIYFGTFETDSSLMTCFVEGLGQGEHIHFIDANNGGYAAAAVQMKAQMKGEIKAAI